MLTFSLLDAPTRFLFFTGKGGVGKTSLACATAIGLADHGRRILLVSTDPASNLDEMLGIRLSDIPSPILGIPRLMAMNIDPEAAADNYRARVLMQLDPEATSVEKSTIREQLSGSCTTEIAAFDEFVGLLAGDITGYDHIVFDTAPTGHTLRLLSLPKAWTGFLEGNDQGASCLGPHSGLKMQEERFRKGMDALSDAGRTTIVLVTRADRGAIREAARTSEELLALGLTNQVLAVNGRFFASSKDDTVAESIERDQIAAIAAMPASLAALPHYEIPLREFDMVGIPALRLLLSPMASIQTNYRHSSPTKVIDLPGLSKLTDEIAASGRGLIMVMGKGGVGKTTAAAALAIGLAKRGHDVHLSTTDPAAHLSFVVDGTMARLTVDRIDPAIETRRYIEKIMSTKGRGLDAEGQALLREDLASPCTEEVAVFHAFSRVVAEARSAFVVLDTAPTGHTLLLMDSTGAYHRQMTRDRDPNLHGRMVTPLMRLQDAQYTKVIIVTLPETTPVSEATTLQDDLRRAKIEPFAWLINKSLATTETHDPLLSTRIRNEVKQIERVRDGLAKRAYMLPWRATPPIGVVELSSLT